MPAKPSKPQVPGLIKGLGVTLRTAKETIFPDGPGGVSIHSINSCFFMYPVRPDFEPDLDDHHSDVKWVRKIPKGVHPYVERCLMGAGLSK